MHINTTTTKKQNNFISRTTIDISSLKKYIKAIPSFFFLHLLEVHKSQDQSTICIEFVLLYIYLRHKITKRSSVHFRHIDLSIVYFLFNIIRTKPKLNLAVKRRLPWFHRECLE